MNGYGSVDDGEALVRYLMAQKVLTENGTELLFGGMWAIFGHWQCGRSG